MANYVVWNVQRGLVVEDGLTYAAACALQERLEYEQGEAYIIFQGAWK